MEKTKRKNNYAITLLCIILILPFLSMHGVKANLREDVYQSWQTIAMIVCLTLMLVKSERIQMNWAVCLFGIYQGVILLSNIMHNGFSPGIVVSIITAFLFFSLLQTEHYYEILSAVSIIVVGAMLINFPIMLTKLGNPNAVFFIGGKNFLGTFLIPGIFLMLINSLEQHGKITKPVLLAVALAMLTIFLGSSGTGIVVALCAVLFMLISMKYKPKKGLYMGILLTIYMLFLVFAESFFLTDLWLEFTDLLGKDGSLTARTEIWKTVRTALKDNIWLGLGRGAELRYLNMLNRTDVTYEAHNYIMEILFQGGLIALVIYGILFFKTVKPLNMDNETNRMVFIALFIILVNGLTEAINNSFLVIMLLGVACKFANEQMQIQRAEMRARHKKEMQELQSNELRRVRRWRNG